MSAVSHLLVAVAVTLACTAPLAAQDASLETVPATAGAPAPGGSVRALAPTFASATLDLGSRTTPAVAPTMAVAMPASRENVAWMVVGGAALVVGTIIGGDTGTVVMVGGAAVGLIGLYRYLR